MEDSVRGPWRCVCLRQRNTTESYEWKTQSDPQPEPLIPAFGPNDRMPPVPSFEAHLPPGIPAISLPRGRGGAASAPERTPLTAGVLRVVTVRPVKGSVALHS
eukprot:1191395-Prorocentrum_minimum.AAC.3